MPTPAQRREERRQNLIAIVIGLGIAALMFGFLIRPAVVLPVGETALETSIGGTPTECAEHEGGFTCDITRSRSPQSTSGGPRARYEVEVDFAGCWRARQPAGRGFEGCINLTDYFG